MIQRASEEEDEERSVVAGVALDVLLDAEASLGGGGREGVGVGGGEEGGGPWRRLGGEVIGGELPEGIKAEEREERDEVREERDEGTGDSGRGGSGGGDGSGGCGGGGRRRRRREAVEVGGALVEEFDVAAVAEP